jgi:hypothetical protein
MNVKVKVYCVYVYCVYILQKHACKMYVWAADGRSKAIEIFSVLGLIHPGV